MTKKKTQTERERLEEQVKTCRRSRGDANRNHAEAGKRLDELETERRQLLIDAARGESKAEANLTENATARAEAEREKSEWRDREAAAKSAADSAERALRQHLSDNLEAFMESADQLAEKAMADRQRVLDSVQTARASEKAAQDEWNTLSQAVLTTKQQRLGPIPPSPLDSVTEVLAKASRPEPREVARARKVDSRRRVDLPGALAALFKGKRRKGDWTPIPDEEALEV